MNQEKIGKFIAELRKEKSMTQNELADKLGVTDRAISKWENGRGMPDLSLLMPLCKILDISINELLCGEKLDREEYQEKFEENIINTIDYTDKKIKSAKKGFTVVLTGVILVFVILITLFCIDVNRMRNNKPVLFSTWGAKYAPPVDIKEDEIEVAILDYLIKKGDNEHKYFEDEKAFASMRIYFFEEKEPYYDVYAWVLEGTYYLEDDEIKQDSSSSIPYKFVVKNTDGEFKVTDVKIPRDGYYIDDMKNIFPRTVRNDMDNVYIDGTFERLELDIQQQIKLYFHR